MASEPNSTLSSMIRELMSDQMFGYHVSKCVDPCCITDVLGTIQICNGHICLERTPNFEKEVFGLYI